jgi:hypothetical protein
MVNKGTCRDNLEHSTIAFQEGECWKQEHMVVDIICVRVKSFLDDIVVTSKNSGVILISSGGV